MILLTLWFDFLYQFGKFLAIFSSAIFLYSLAKIKL